MWVQTQDSNALVNMVTGSRIERAFNVISFTDVNGKATTLFQSEEKSVLDKMMRSLADALSRGDSLFQFVGEMPELIVGENYKPDGLLAEVG